MRCSVLHLLLQIQERHVLWHLSFCAQFLVLQICPPEEHPELLMQLVRPLCFLIDPPCIQAAVELLQEPRVYLLVFLIFPLPTVAGHLCFFSTTFLPLHWLYPIVFAQFLQGYQSSDVRYCYFSNEDRWFVIEPCHYCMNPPLQL